MLSLMLVAMKARTSGGDAAEVLGLGLLAEDGEAGLELGRLDVGDQAPLEPGPEAVLEAGDRLRGPVGRDDDLAALAVELVERVEELLLELLGAFEELDVVDQQHVEVAVAALEAGHRLGADRVDEFVHERLGGDVAHPLVPEHGADVVPDRVQEVGLAQPGRAVDEQRVVGPAGALGDGQGRGVREAVGGPDDELVEGVAAVQRAGGPGGGGLVGALRQSRRRPGAGSWSATVTGGGARTTASCSRGAVSTWSSTVTVSPERVEDRVGEHAGVARADAFGREGARDAEHEGGRRRRETACTPWNHAAQVAGASWSRRAVAPWSQMSSAVTPPSCSLVHRNVHSCGDRRVRGTRGGLVRTATTPRRPVGRRAGDGALPGSPPCQAGAGRGRQRSTRPRCRTRASGVFPRVRLRIASERCGPYTLRVPPPRAYPPLRSARGHPRGGPSVKRTFQPNNRKRAKTHGFRHPHAYPWRPGRHPGARARGRKRLSA